MKILRPMSTYLCSASRNREAPVDWILGHCRLRIAMVLLQWMVVDLCFFMCGQIDEGDWESALDLEASASDTFVCWMALVCGVLRMIGLVCVLTKVATPRILEAYLCCMVMLDVVFRSARGSTGELCILLMVSTLAVFGIRLRPLVLTMIMIVGLLVLQWLLCATGINVMQICIVSSWCVLGALFAKSQQSDLRCLFDAQLGLAVQSKASTKLLSMVCDAACWLAVDGNTILGSDPRLDEIFGCRVSGMQFSSFLPEEERNGFQSATTSAGAQPAQAPVVLLPSTLNGAGMHPHRVDLFIADIRAELDIAAEQDQPGFLVGIRLIVPDQVAPAMPNHDFGTQLNFMSAQNFSASGCSEVMSPCGEEARSLPETLRSFDLPRPVLHTCTREAVRESLLSSANDDDLPSLASPRARDTLLATLELVCDHALGGTLVCVADCQAYHQVFGAKVPAMPCTRSSDQGYMTERLRGVHVSDVRFQEAFREFTQHTRTDRWPEEHHDEKARGLPKDGALLLSTEGYRVQCSAKLLGLQPAVAWENVGTKHDAAFACAWSVTGAVVFVKSDSGPIHLVTRRGGSLHVYRVCSDA